MYVYTSMERGRGPPESQDIRTSRRKRGRGREGGREGGREKERSDIGAPPDLDAKRYRGGSFGFRTSVLSPRLPEDWARCLDSVL